MSIYLLRKMLIIACVASVGLPATTFGVAVLSLDPATGTFAVGGTFSVSVLLDTGGADVNLIESSISFPPDKLEVVSPSGGKSVVSIWTDTPKFDNSKGIISFQGGTPNPGVNVRRGLVTSITFAVKAPGTAALSFSPASRVFLNDGFGTDILGAIRRGTYNLVSGFPGGPVVISPTHPDGASWYESRAATLRWQTEEGAKGYSYILNDSPLGAPDDVSESLAPGVDYSGLTDGVYYFHVKSLKGGAWGGVTDFRLQIDATPPEEFLVQITPSRRTSERQPLIYFETKDAISGVQRYEIAIVGVGEIPTADAYLTARSPYIPPEQLPLGRYRVFVKAFDKAGNIREASQELEIVKPTFEIVPGVGIRFGSSQISFRAFFVGLGVFLVLLGQYVVSRIRAWRRRVHGEDDSAPPTPPQSPPPILPVSPTVDTGTGFPFRT
ncbi:hypothetical protein C4571_00160 [Candidatus Parcubacteria bacterium]|nr:MAG: hypothetical protein C4571_00160 [Candidatus Parcubacteria bacterium]